MQDHDELDYRPLANGLGHRSSRGRVAHLLCGLIARKEMSDAGQNGFELSLNLVLAGQALGLTPIHVRVALKRLGNDGLIITNRRTVRILDIERLKALADLDRIA